MTRPMMGARRPALQSLARKAGWVVVVGMAAVASVWASEPGAADPSPSSWIPGQTVTTWDWERHWNYWMEWTCSSVATVPGIGNQVCHSWTRVGPTWKPCGREVRPPQPGETNTCNIGRPGGHRPHGDNVTERYTYLGRHEDRTGPTYAICAGDPALPPGTGPGNCGTWVSMPHIHCPGGSGSHPPDCPPTETTPVEGSRPPAPEPGPAPPDDESAACKDPRVAAAVTETVDRQPDPGHGLQPSSHGYVRLPLRVHYPYDPLIDATIRIGDRTVDLRIWIAEVSWSFTDVGAADGGDLGSRTFRRTAADHQRASMLNTPAEVVVGGRSVAYLRSSLSVGYPAGYPIAVKVVWRAECREYGSPGFVDADEETRRFGDRYQVYEIRSRPNHVAPAPASRREYRPLTDRPVQVG